MLKKENIYDLKITTIFVIIPTILLISLYFFYPYDPNLSSEHEHVFEPIHTLIVLAIIFLGAGFFTDKKVFGKKLKMIGWIAFAIFWSTQPKSLYLSEEGDIFNAILCIIGVYALFYFAYQEWLSDKRKEQNKTLNWIAGAAFIAAAIYYGIEKTPLAMWLRQLVAAQSAGMLNLITGEEVRVGGLDNLLISYKKSNLYLIFACTGVQSMVIFIGVLAPLKNVNYIKRFYGILITVIPIYILNLLRNAMISYLVGNNITDFSTAHNYLAKAGSLITLIVLLFILIKIIPELFDEINKIIDLPKRKGPIERFFIRYIWGKK